MDSAGVPANAIIIREAHPLKQGLKLLIRSRTHPAPSSIAVTDPNEEEVHQEWINDESGEVDVVYMPLEDVRDLVRRSGK
jgi:hypothetical protein